MNTIHYVVSSGDTLWSIANRYNSTVDILTRYNGLILKDNIYIGQTLKIPITEKQTPDLYIVRIGDTLCSISKRYDIPLALIMQLNDIENSKFLYAGKILRLKP